jgi:hypothetical protein
MVSIAYSAVAYALAAAAALHPIHSSLTELTYDSRAGMATIAIRVYADDVQTALGAAWRDRLPAYVARTFTVRTADGQPLPLTPCGVTVADGLIRACMRASVPHRIDGLHVDNRLLIERFADQVNIVKATYGGRSRTIVFSAGTGERVLP